MSQTVDTRTVTVPIKIYTCNRCGVEHLDLPGQPPIGWICCHDLAPAPEGPFEIAPQPPDQHLCSKCKHLVAEAVRAAPLPAPEISILRAALERIARECGTPMRKLSPSAIAMIATEALAGREATPEQLAAIKPVEGGSILDAVAKVFSTGKPQLVALPIGPPPRDDAQDPPTNPPSGETTT